MADETNIQPILKQVAAENKFRLFVANNPKTQTLPPQERAELMKRLNTYLSSRPNAPDTPSLASRIWKAANQPLSSPVIDPLEWREMPSAVGLLGSLAGEVAGPLAGRAAGAGIQALGRGTKGVLSGAADLSPEGQWLLGKILPTKALASLAGKVENLGLKLKMSMTPTEFTPQQQRIVRAFDELAGKLRASAPPEASVAAGDVPAAKQMMAGKIAARQPPVPTRTPAWQGVSGSEAPTAQIGKGNVEGARKLIQEKIIGRAKLPSSRVPLWQKNPAAWSKMTFDEKLKRILDELGGEMPEPEQAERAYEKSEAPIDLEDLLRKSISTTKGRK